jgi:hypothetical protein
MCSCFHSYLDENDHDEDEGEAQFSEEDEKPVKPMAKTGKMPSKIGLSAEKNQQVDLAKLPFLKNNGLNYLPEMQYFSLGKPCPMQPTNLVEGKALLALIHLPTGGFNCIAIPIEAVEGVMEVV